MSVRFGLALLALLCTTAHAGRPLATEDADVLDAGACEWESFVAQSRGLGSPTERAATTQFGCGFGLRSQAALAYSRARSDGVTVEGLLLGGKTRLVPRGDDAAGWTLAWGATGTREPGHSFEHEASYLVLVATRPLSDGLLGHANFGWLSSKAAHADTTTWNLALEQAVGSGVDAMGELYGDDRSDPWLGLGLRWTVGEHLSVNGSWSRQGGGTRPRLWTLGVKLAF